MKRGLFEPFRLLYLAASTRFPPYRSTISLYRPSQNASDPRKMFAKYTTKTLKEKQAESANQKDSSTKHLMTDDLEKIEAEALAIKKKVEHAERDLEGSRARLEKALDKLWASKNELDKKTRTMDTFEYSGSGAFAESKQNWILREEIVELLDRMDRLGGEETEENARGRKRIVKPERKG